MSPADLAAIKARAEAATKGPWEAEVTSDGTYIGTYSGKRSDPYDGDLPLVDTRLFEAPRKWASTLEDCYFIAHARTDIPALVAEVARYERREALVCEALADALKVPLVFTDDDAAAGYVRVLGAEVERLRGALEGAKIGHAGDRNEPCFRWERDDPALPACDCGADAHNAAIDKALRGEA